MLQKLGTNTCGAFTIFVLKQLDKGVDFHDIVYSLTQKPSDNNEEFITKFVR